MTMNGFDIDEIERLLAAAEEDLIWEDQVLRKLDLAHAVMDHFPAMIAELRELRAGNARLKEGRETLEPLLAIAKAITLRMAVDAGVHEQLGWDAYALAEGADENAPALPWWKIDAIRAALGEPQ